MAKPKDRQQWEMEGELPVLSCLMWMAQVLILCWIHFYLLF